MLIEKLSRDLLNLNQPIITYYQLGIVIFDSYLKAERQNTTNLKEYFAENVEKLREIGIIEPFYRAKEHPVFKISGKKYSSGGEIYCSIDPFAYISHLSAMDFYGLTDRLPKILFVTTPSDSDWRRNAKEKMKKDAHGQIDQYLKAELPRLKKPAVDNKIMGFPVNQHSSKYQGAFRVVKDSPLRVSKIGRTFLDMLRSPDLCGGMHHVIDVFENHGRENKNLIINEIDSHGKDIEKVRAGYLLENICKIQDPRIEEWLGCVQRGGSRKLNPAMEYSPNYDERWCLSLNI